ncbi:MAG: DUF3795 domain-containing protein [Dehalococcoidia bacterium]|nr:DUF3795 domain-containing protein [Dehalococcoidia bacterium]
MRKGICPNGESGCSPRENPYCAVSSCAYKKGVRLCFECAEFPCAVIKTGPVSYGYCEYLAGKG